MVRQKDSAQIRADALRVGAQKLVTGCEPCADGYFALARQHGATEADIKSAIADAGVAIEQFQISRRVLLKTLAMGVITTSVASAASGLPQFVSASEAVNTSAPAEQISWFFAVGERPDAPPRLLGIDPNGLLTGKIDQAHGLPLRSVDRQSLLIPSVRSDPTTARVIIERYDANTGAALSVIEGAPLAVDGNTVASGRSDFDAIKTVLSPDGQYAVVLHKTRRLQLDSVERAVKYIPNYQRKLGEFDWVVPEAITVGKVTTTTSLELIDLNAEKSVDFQELYVEDGVRLGGELFVAPGDRVYELSFDGKLRIGVTVAQIGGDLLGSPTRFAAGQTGNSPAPELGAYTSRGSYYLSPDGRQLTCFVAPEHVYVFNLEDLSLREEFSIGYEQSARPYSPAAIFSSDGHQLLVINSTTGSLRVVDFGAKTIEQRVIPHPSTQRAATLAGPRASDRRGIAALTRDGRRLFVVDGRGDAGIVSLSIGDLSTGELALPDQPIKSLHPGADGQTIFAELEGNDGLLVAFDGAGRVVGGVQIGNSVLWSV